MGCQCSTQHKLLRRPGSAAKSQSGTGLPTQHDSNAPPSSTPATVEDTPREAEENKRDAGTCEEAKGECEHADRRGREEAERSRREADRGAAREHEAGRASGISEGGRAAAESRETETCGAPGDVSAGRRDANAIVEEKDSPGADGPSPLCLQPEQDEDPQRRTAGDAPSLSCLSSAAGAGTQDVRGACCREVMETHASAAGGRKRRGEEVENRAGNALCAETESSPPLAAGALRATEKRPEFPPPSPARPSPGACGVRPCPGEGSATSVVCRRDGSLRSYPSDGSPSAIFSSPYKRRSSGRPSRSDDAVSAAPIAGACSRHRDGKPGNAGSATSAAACSEGREGRGEHGKASRRSESSRSVVCRRVSSAATSRDGEEGPVSTGCRARPTKTSGWPIASQAAYRSASSSSQWKRATGCSKKAAGFGDGDWSCLSPLAYSQQKLLPSHLSSSLTVSEILLESSIVGRYVMLPWNEEDGDIRQNFYVDCPPPGALPSSPLSQVVATHASAPPSAPPTWNGVPSDPAEGPACLGSSPCAGRAASRGTRRAARGDREKRCSVERDELEAGLYTRAVLTPERLVKSSQEVSASGSRFGGGSSGRQDARGGQGEGRSTEKTKRSYQAQTWTGEADCTDGLTYGFGGFPKQGERHRREAGSDEFDRACAQGGSDLRKRGGDAAVEWVEGASPSPSPPACRTALPLASASGCSAESSGPSGSFSGSYLSDPSGQAEPESVSAAPASADGDAPVCGLGSPCDDALGQLEWGPDGKWTDPDGVMSLSRKQQQKFAAWKRLSEIVKDPVVIQDVPNSRAIRQGFVGDCSFLSSLAVLSEFERKHNVPVLSGLLYPQGAIPAVADGGRQVGPIFNPRGMYACRLYFNGVPRKVLIDDYVPVRKDNKLLAAHSSNKRELWVTLLEKAFVKLMGGSYSMQGSNPGADLYHLTGWIPETIPFRSDVHTGSPASHKPIVTGRENEDDQVVKDPKWSHIWTQLFLGLSAGRCVACLGTSEVSDAAPSGLDFPEGVSVSSGIVARHAYSILNYAEIEGHRLLYVKNPWGCVRWKGKFSPSDKTSWTQNMKDQLGYDPATAAKSDCGCFWIEWLDVVRWFSHLYVCWDSSCFPYQAEIHSKWERSPFIENSSLADDSHMVAFNPQFHLQISPRPEDFASSALAGPHPFLSFPSLTSPASAASLPLPSTSAPATPRTPQAFPTSFSQENQPVELWILLSRHVRERQKDLATKYLAIHLHAASERATCPPPPAKQGVYSNGECTLVKLRVHPHVFRDLFLSRHSSEDSRLASREGRQEDEGRTRDPGNGEENRGQETSSARPPLPGYEGLQLLDASEFVLVVSQYSQKDEFNFTIKVYGHVHSSLTQLPPLLPPDAQSIYFKGSWGPTTAGGCSNDLWRYFTNPHIRLKVPQPCDAIFFLESPQEHSVNLRLFKNRVATARLLRTGKALSTGPYRAGCCMLKARLDAATYTIIPSTFRPDDLDNFQLSLHVPGNVAKPRPMLLPQPYAIPPPSPLFYRVVDGRKCMHQVWSRVALQVQGPTLVALRLQLPGPPEPRDAFPSLTVYRYTETAERERAERERDERKSQKKLHFVIRSDLDGGLSEDGHTASSAAQDLFQKQGVVNVSSVELLDPLSPYVIFISTLNGEEDADGCPVYAHSREAALHYLHRQEGRRKEEPPSSRPWMLHVIADNPLDVQLLL
ncbi:hypothetical protein NCLIV_000790 [Neospora caninum Liverpool]|nr:hypothetical protein NCLIV_000790 [Neospora caninum Liverpool]CBZ49585.1 hypothetical protein NCLIV_000790 [Neospora caninum Liverpool]|eukprot:XP_003879620.1 hypothetical protein NCLIV_000790 [Neospora caninum Liverpool]